ncbi:MAG: response regulator transcription factor [Lachnospiraceae bacterium]|nr:response regulator transcription factor [Lachnospiraceae bacterium]
MEVKIWLTCAMERKRKVIKVLRIAICDDDQDFLHYLKQKIIGMVAKQTELEFFEYQSGKDLLRGLQNKKEMDALFLDVQLPEMDGYMVAREFRQKYNSTVLVFCSGVCPPTPESFKVTPYRYLLKQYSDRRFESELHEVFDYVFQNQKKPFIWGIFEKAMYKLTLDDVLYISIAKRGCTIHLMPNSFLGKKTEVMSSPMKLAEIYPSIQDCGFSYAHNSYVVNMKYIMRRNVAELEMMGGNKLTISRSKIKNFDTDFVKFLASKY